MSTHSIHIRSDGHAAEVTIRRLSVDDDAAVTRLAQLDSSRAPAGVLLGAELDGRLMAAISATTGEVIADPFHRTAELVEALRMNAGQNGGRPGGSSRGLLSRCGGRLRRSGFSRRAASAVPAGPSSAPRP